MSEVRDQLSVIEIARDLGPEVLAFLRDVAAGNHLKLRLDSPISMRDRLQAVEILRKFASLPSNVAVDLGSKEVLIYVGDSGLEERVRDAERGVPERMEEKESAQTGPVREEAPKGTLPKSKRKVRTL